MNKFLACAAACLLMAGAQTASADHRWDRGHSHYHHHGKGHGHHHHRDHDRVSVRVNIGNVIPDWRYRDYRRATSGLGIAYSTTWGPAYNRGGNTVIVHQNTYVNPEPRVIHRSTSSTSLLRDINGRCFERRYDSRGNETRIELPPSSCNF